MTRTAKYFSGDMELSGIRPIDNAKAAAMFPSVKARRYDGYSRMFGTSFGSGELLPVTRVIYYSTSPSMHKCDARCTHAKGGNCECSCGGKLHGTGGA